MNRLGFACVRIVRWSGWPLFPVVLGFLLTGYIISGRYGLGKWLDETTALAVHKLLHWPLIVLVLVHALAALYVTLQRWGWLRKTRKTPPTPAA